MNTASTSFCTLVLAAGLSCSAIQGTLCLAGEAVLPTAPDFSEKAQAIGPWLIEVRKDLHRHPEIGFEEVRTSGKVKACLQAAGIEYWEMVGTGVCGIVRGKHPGPTIAIRADMDALPIADTKAVDYASQIPNRCHACGHDAHTTILMGTARVLQSVKDDLCGNVKLIFEPAEEIGGGAAEMVAKGVLKEPDVEAVLGLHMCHSAPGKVFVKRNGPMHVASSPIRIHVKGKAGHSAFIAPDVNSTLVAGDVLAELHTLANRLNSTCDTRLGIGSVQAGVQENATSEEAVVLGTIRCVTEEGVMRVRSDIEQVLDGISEKTGCRCTLEAYTTSNKPVYNQAELVDLLVEVAADVLGEGQCEVSESKAPACFGGESFGAFSSELPSLFFWLGGAKGRPHTGEYDIEHDVLPLGVALHCRLAWEYLARGSGATSKRDEVGRR